MGQIKNGVIVGSVVPFSSNVATSWNGKQVIKSPIKNQVQTLSPRIRAIRGLFKTRAIFGLKNLTQEQKDKWALFAQRLNDNTSRLFNGSGNIYPEHEGPYTWFNAYVASNTVARLLFLPFMRLDPPDIELPFPAPPEITSLVWNGSAIEMTYTYPDLSAFAPSPQYTVRVNVAVQSKNMSFKYRVNIIDIPFPPPPSDTVFLSFAIARGYRRGSVVYPLSAFRGGRVSMQMVSQIAKNATQGFIWGAPGNVRSVDLV